MNIKPIKTYTDHNDPLREIEALWGAAEETAEGDRFVVLATLAEAYEETRCRRDEMDPVAAIEAAMPHDGYTRADLANLIGNSRATEILKSQRSLTLPMICRIAKEWNLPEGLLVREYAVG